MRLGEWNMTTTLCSGVRLRLSNLHLGQGSFCGCVYKLYNELLLVGGLCEIEITVSSFWLSEWDTPEY